MGLFTRRAPSATATWRPDGTGVRSNGNRDGQVGDSYSARFIRDDKPGSLITVAFYVVKGSTPNAHCVQREVEWMVCGDPSDPGGTEVWSDVEYSDLEDAWYASAEQAEVAARDCARSDLANGTAYFGWDGDPEW